jgi:hypothetical protein
VVGLALLVPARRSAGEPAAAAPAMAGETG